MDEDAEEWLEGRPPRRVCVVFNNSRFKKSGYPVVTQAARSKPGKLSPTSQKSTTRGIRLVAGTASLAPSALEGDNCPEITRGAKDGVATKRVRPMANIYGTS
jgi:hypothetical protein